jgi:hypothetical protein
VLHKFLFVYSEKDGSFPERLLVIRDGHDGRIPDSDQLTGTVEESDEDGLRERLSESYPCPEFRVATAWGNRWKAVRDNYAGLDYEYDSPPRSSTPPPSEATPEEPPSAADGPAPSTHPDEAQALGSLLLATSATATIKALFLLASAFCLVAAAATWTELSAGFSGLNGWILALVSDPVNAAPSLIPPLALVAGLVMLLRFVHYARAKVLVFESGILVRPKNRSVRWTEVEHLWDARRSLRSYGVPLPTGHSLRLEVDGGRPLDIPHRFNEMEDLISLVRTHVEPLLLDRARERLAKGGKLSLGRRLSLTRDHLNLEDLGVAFPLAKLGRFVVRGGTLQIFNTDNRVIYSGSAELFPDVFIISPLLDELKSTT